MIKGQRYVSLPTWKAEELIIRHHYLHRSCHILWAFGIEVEGEIRGVLTIGKPCSDTACRGVCGKERAKDVFELNRLWLHDSLPPNSESQFVGFILRKLRQTNPSLILLSYADSLKAHVGFVYQATNWIYTGQTIRWKDKVAAGEFERTAKHRYVWLANADDRQLMKWKPLPYPKTPATFSITNDHSS